MPSQPRKVLLGLIGAGIQQSLTPGMQEAEGRQHGLSIHYQLIDLDVHHVGIDSLPVLIEAAKLMGFAGLNITFPCKQAVMPLLDELSEEARAMGAVNTVVFRDGRAMGHNTDGSGWAAGLLRTLPHADVSHVVLLGGGGAGAAIAHSLMRMGVKRLSVVERDAAKGAALVEALNAQDGDQRASAWVEAKDVMPSATGLVHATPTGMAKLPGLPLDAALLSPRCWVSEIVYSPIETELLKVARSKGCATVDGGGMAIGQAVGAFRLFTGLEPDAARMDANFRQLLAARGS